MSDFPGRQTRRLALRFAAAVTILLVGCGGGGDSTGDSGNSNIPPPPSPPPPPVTSVSFAGNSVSLSRDTTLPGNAVAHVAFSIQNLPEAGIWTRVTVAGAALYNGTVALNSSTGGRVELLGRVPGTLGAGTYQGTARVEICLDERCATHAQGSPMEIAATYLVTGSALPTTRVRWENTPLSGAEFVTADVRNPQMKVQVSVSALPFRGLYLRGNPPAKDIIQDVSFGQPTFSTVEGVAFGEFTISLRPPAALGSGMFQDSVTFRACFDQACTQPVPDAVYTLQLNFLVSATEGLEFTSQVVELEHGASDVAWSPATEALYVSPRMLPTGGLTPTSVSRISAVNPRTLATTSSAAFTGEVPGLLAVVPEGTHLYAASRYRPVVHRLRLPGLESDIAITVGDLGSQDPPTVSDLGLLPGQPRSVVVATSLFTEGTGVRVYDDSVPRPSMLAPVPHERERMLIPAGQAGRFISQKFTNPPLVAGTNALQQIAVDASGLRVVSEIPTTGGHILQGKAQRAGNRLITPYGVVVDASTGLQVGALDLPEERWPYDLLVDEARSRIYVWSNIIAEHYLLSYDLATLELLAIAKVDTPAPAAPEMVSWGTDGLALVDGHRLIVFSGPFFTTYRGEPTLGPNQ